MSTPAPGRKLSTADLATPDPATPVARTDEDQRPEEQPEGRIVAGPDARRVAAAEAGQPVTPEDARRADMRPEAPTDKTPQERTTDDEEVSALFQDDACHALWKRWDDVQAGFVDEPRRAVQDADSLVAETMQQLANTFARERGNLEQQWGRGDNVSTEDLRIAFRRYRSFFKRLLSV
jgi:hypothetical protein